MSWESENIYDREWLDRSVDKDRNIYFVAFWTNGGLARLDQYAWPNLIKDFNGLPARIEVKAEDENGGNKEVLAVYSLTKDNNEKE